ncbi:MAG TPA: CaiB/BaiF CoA-transferase family protein [Polyangiaceae bacterium]|jgi:crotonobetainyl-CoA:carnitine CoA-transferase CaiB-like acyl-CoA transferase|nr:CaiB/BaiF CoA-transferase family protein [Polyangiaceae bacterium]
MRPLTDIRVLDLSRLLPGPFATLVLADLGAVVDKIEDTGGGDYLRHMPPLLGGQSAMFQLLNRGKRSAILDLKKPEGREAFKRLVASYDVLFDQFRPGVLSRLGLGHGELHKLNPKLIICCLTGYGQEGPLAHRAGHDLNYLARSGILSAQGPAGGPPQVPGVQLADISGGMWCVIGILAAIAERARTGKGAVLDIAMTDGVLGFATPTIAGALAGVPPRAGDEALSGGIAPYNTYLSKDGHAMTLASLEPKFWMAFCAGVGLEVGMEALMPGPHQAALKARVADIFHTKSREEWVAFAAAHDCCLEPVLDASSIVDDPLIAARRLVFDIPTPRGPLPQFRTPVTPKDESFTPPPLAGEHTRAIFRDAGFSDDEIDALVQSGAAREET